MNDLRENGSLARKAKIFRQRAKEVLEESGVAQVWADAGCKVEVVGSMRMGLMARHRDIDLHVYSPEISEESSFAIAAMVARNPRVKEIKCINGLMTDECCVAWHFSYEAADGETWQFDVIHIVEGSRYDGFFEEMADRIVLLSSDEQKETILKLKFETPDNLPEPIPGVEYYEAVMDGGVSTLDELLRWVDMRRSQPPHYWMPQ